jgi:hypothetical protein
MTNILLPIGSLKHLDKTQRINTRRRIDETRLNKLNMKKVSLKLKRVDRNLVQAQILQEINSIR